VEYYGVGPDKGAGTGNEIQAELVAHLTPEDSDPPPQKQSERQVC